MHPPTLNFVSPMAKVYAHDRGLPKVVYLISRLLTATIGIMSGDEEIDYASVLEDWDTDNTSQH